MVRFVTKLARRDLSKFLPTFAFANRTPVHVGLATKHAFFFAAFQWRTSLASAPVAPVLVFPAKEHW